MTELELLGPRAYGESLGSAVLKATAEDFQVDEVLDIPLSGDGAHLWIWVEKRGLNTEEAARRLARSVSGAHEHGREAEESFVRGRAQRHRRVPRPGRVGRTGCRSGP